MSELRALLLTDVVDSTKLSERIGDAAMAEVWIAHDRAARDLLPSWRGREIDKTDGMLLLFESAADALGYAFAYHRALAALPVPLKARAGLHVGPVILRENPPEDVARGAKPLEVEGLAKPTTARVMSLARGGQILLTPEARAALGEVPIRMVSHGHWVMKGLAEPIELFEACDADTVPAEPPDSDKVYRVVRAGERWLPVAQLPNNLPQQATSFIGRERELDEVKALLAQARLITLLGMGGLGKTRLSLQVAAEVMPQYPDGAWFIDLTPIREAARVTDEAARVLGVAEEPGRPLLQTLGAYLRVKRLLLILDNCEQVIHAAAELVAALLTAAPQVRVLASSRETLRVPGEQAYPILPLPLPKKDDSLETLTRSTAVRLFVERAQAHKPAFALGEKEAPAVAELVARLEGIPLALELAAARVKLLSVADINARLRDRYKLLTGGSRTLQARQQTLRALVDWSYDLLNEPEKCVLGRLAVFVGGFDLAAAEAVCGAEPIDTLDVLDLLGSLVDKSLVMHEERDDGSRYRMLETIREYAREKLDQQPAEAAATAARHCQHYFALAKEANLEMNGPQQGQWTRRVEAEIDNLREAITLALSGGVDVVIAVKFAVALARFWMLRGYATEGRAVVRSALALPAIESSDLARAWALYVGAILARNQGEHAEARSMLETCLELRRRLGKPVEIASTLSTLALSRLHAGDPDAAVQSETEALRLFRDLGDRIGEAIGLLHLGQIALYRGDVAAARAELEQARMLAGQIDHHEVVGESELLLGEAALAAGDPAEAGARLEASLAICREAGDRHGEANARRWLGRCALESGNLSAAREHLGEALRAFHSFEMREELVDCLEDHAALLHAEGRPAEGLRLASMAAGMRERLALSPAPRAAELQRLRLVALRESLGEAEASRASEEGRGWSTDQAVRAALGAASAAGVR
jgi:predicted ATPase/class 3 adenylate cyclase